MRTLANIQRPDGKPRYFFRGQSQHWPNAVNPSITPTIDRPRLNQSARNQALTVCLQAKLLGRGIDGYPIPTIEHAIGILRHYSWPTPVLDITDDPDVALWFALNDRVHGGQAYMLVLDSTTFAQEGIEIGSHRCLWPQVVTTHDSFAKAAGPYCRTNGHPGQAACGAGGSHSRRDARE
jgi:hypothetical protein